MPEPRVCHVCGTETDAYCPTCLAAFPNRRPAAGMSGDARAAEMALIYGPVEIPFDLIHQRIEELVGRPVWTHELVHREALIEEARTWEHVGFAEVLERLPEGMETVVVVGGGS